MPILGIIASSKLTASGSFDFIATATASGSSNTITFSSIPQTYKHLQLRFAGKNNRDAAQAGWLNLKVNNVDASYLQAVYSYNASAPEQLNVTSPGIANGYTLAATGTQADALNFGAGLVNILDYTSTSKAKTYRHMSGALSGSQVVCLIGTNTFNSTSAVTSLVIQGVDGANIGANSRFSLYGLKDA
jgi:hypothetical protein